MIKEITAEEAQNCREALLSTISKMVEAGIEETNQDKNSPTATGD